MKTSFIHKDKVLLVADFALTAFSVSGSSAVSAAVLSVHAERSGSAVASVQMSTRGEVTASPLTSHSSVVGLPPDHRASGGAQQRHQSGCARTRGTERSTFRWWSRGEQRKKHSVSQPGRGGLHRQRGKDTDRRRRDEHVCQTKAENKCVGGKVYCLFWNVIMEWNFFSLSYFLDVPVVHKSLNHFILSDEVEEAARLLVFSVITLSGHFQLYIL